MASESPAATMESVDGTTPSTVSSRRSAEARGRRLERERARWRQRLASETAAERERRWSQRRARDGARRAAAPRRPARHASCRWGLLSVEDERQKLPTRERLAWLSPESTLLAYEHMFMLNDFPSLRIVQADKQILPQ